MTDAGKQAAVTNVLTASPPGWNKGDLLAVVLPPVEDETWVGKNQPPLGETVVCDGMSMTGNVYLRDYEPEFGWHPSRFRPVQQAAISDDSQAGTEPEGRSEPLNPDNTNRLGEGAETDLQILRSWLDGLGRHEDLNEVCADGGVTSGMVYQQEARSMSERVSRVLAALRPTEQEGR